ncbi:MAG: hypothetical protein DMG57_01835 [Acidobacteria bacterium]|nr:MAG: hypothetical protein DMG57_01835 [Acidobacteriota bacterium]
MNCANHPDIPAAAFCRSCGKPLCETCKRPAQGTIYCDEHVPAQPVSTATATAAPAIPAIRRKGQSISAPLRGWPSPLDLFPAWAPFTTASMPKAWCTPSFSGCW